MLKALQRAKSIVQSPETDTLLDEARARYVEAKSHLAELKERARALEQKLSEIGERLEAFPAKRRLLEVALRGAVTGMALDATKEIRVSELEAEMEKLRLEEHNLEQRRGIFQGDLNHLTSIRGGLECARAALAKPYQELWDQVARILAAQLPADAARQLLRIWTALNTARPTSPGYLLEYVGAPQPDREHHQRAMRELGREFKVPVD